MVGFRSRALPVLASSLCVALVAGCPNAGTQPPLSPASNVPSSPVATSSVAVSGGGSASSPTPSNSPATSDATAQPNVGVSPGAVASTAVVASAPVASGATAVLQGDIFDESAAAVDGATVTIQSLDASHPYKATLITSQGHYVTNSVPVGTQIQVSVTKDGWTSRNRVASYQPNVNANNVMNFGGASVNSADPSGIAYFISNYPEISATVPDADTINGNHVGYKIRVSEPLDGDNQRRLMNAVAISTDPAPGTFTPIVIRNTSTFLLTNRSAAMTWNAEGTELSIAFEAPQRRLRNNTKTYALSLTRPAGDSPIVDKSNNVLGLTIPNPGAQYNAAIKLASLVLIGNETTSLQRWNATHVAASGYDLTPDAVNPTVVAVSGAPVTVSGLDKERITVTLSKPALAYPDVLNPLRDGTLSGSDPSTIDPANYAFAISDNSVGGVDMRKVVTTPNTVTSATTPATVMGYMSSTTPFRVDGTAAHVQVSSSNPNVIQFDILRSLWPTTARYIRVRVEPTWTDPNGNRVSEGNLKADNTADDVKDGTLQ